MPIIRTDEIPQACIHFVDQQQPFTLTPLVPEELQPPPLSFDETLRGIYSQVHATHEASTNFSADTCGMLMSTLGSPSAAAVVGTALSATSLGVALMCKAPLEDIRRNVLRCDTRNGRLDGLNSLEDEADKSYAISLKHEWILPEKLNELAETQAVMHAAVETARVALDKPSAYRRLALMLPWSKEACLVDDAIEAINEFKTDVSDSSKERRRAAIERKRSQRPHSAMARLQEESAAPVEPGVAPDGSGDAGTSESPHHGALPPLAGSISSSLSLPSLTDSAVELTALPRDAAALEEPGQSSDGGISASGSADADVEERGQERDGETSAPGSADAAEAHPGLVSTLDRLD